MLGAEVVRSIAVVAIRDGGGGNTINVLIIHGLDFLVLRWRGVFFVLSSSESI